MAETYMNDPSIPNEIGKNGIKKRKKITAAGIITFRYLGDTLKDILNAQLHILPTRILNRLNLGVLSFSLTSNLSSIF